MLGALISHYRRCLLSGFSPPAAASSEPMDGCGRIHNRKEHRTMPSSVTAPSVEQALRQSPIPALRKLLVEETDSEVVILGSVSSFYLKQLAQETVLPLIGQRGLNNRLKVER
jgi:hypothetical protein